jgi:hypothetical protein
MTRLLRTIAWVSLASPLLWSLSCCPPQVVQPTSGPEVVLRKYCGHLKDKQVELAYQLLSSRMKKHLDRQELKKFLAEKSEHLAGSLQSLFKSSDVEVTVRATLRSEKGEEVQLVRELGGWRIDSGALVPPISATPEDAVQRFLLAVESKDCQALLECAPPPARARHTRKQLLAGCREQIKALQETAARIRASGARPVKTSKHRAEITYLGTHKLLMIEYEGRWYVEDLL